MTKTEAIKTILLAHRDPVDFMLAQGIHDTYSVDKVNYWLGH